MNSESHTTTTTTFPIPPSEKAPCIPKHPRHFEMLGIRKRKPRSTAVITAANQRPCHASPSMQVAPASIHIVPPVAISPAIIQSPHLLPSEPHIAPSNASTLHHRHPHRIAKPSAPVADAKRKGLRHFAVRVSKKVEGKQITTYNEVADELVAEERLIKQRQLAVSAHNHPLENHVVVDEKNIRRRVYDSLNVLMAMRIIAKEKKLITWQGLSMAQSSQGSEKIRAIKSAIAEKKHVIQEKARTHADIKEQFRKRSYIVERNRAADLIPGIGDDLLSFSQNMIPLHHQYPDRLGIPYYVVVAPKDSNIELEMNESRENICFTFSTAFAIYDDREIVRRLSIPNDSIPLAHISSELERFQRHIMDPSTPSVTP